MDDTAAPLVLYADYVCPFCYLGRVALDQYQQTRDTPVSVEWRPFDLRASKRNPDGSIDHGVDDGKDDAYYEQVREGINRLKREYDADRMQPFDGPSRVDSFNAQVASVYVKRHHPDRWDAFDDAVYRALWEANDDIGEPVVLARVADAVGIEPSEVIAAIEDDDLRTDVRTLFNAAHQTGVTAVPTFVYSDHAAQGAIPPEQLKRLIEGH